MKLKYSSFFALALSLFIFSACQTTRVTVLEQSPDFELAAYSSFGFFVSDAEGVLSENYEQHIEYLKDEITQRMEARGLSKQAEGAELKINIGIVVEERDQVRETSLTTDPGTFNYIGQRNYTWQSEEIKVGTYRQGTVTIHLVDAERNEAVWVGISDRVIEEREERLQRTIREGVAEMFDKIP